MNTQPRIGDGSRGNILVTGGAGYVGSNIVCALAQAGYRPIIYDNLSTGSYNVARFGEIENGDMRDRDRLRSVVLAHQPLAVIHAATAPSMAHVENAPKDMYEAIVLGTLNLIEVMRDAQITMLAMISSSAVYGESSGLFVSEQAPTLPLTPFGANLAAAEVMISDFSIVGELRWASLRIFSASGASPDDALGEGLNAKLGLIPTAIDAIFGHRPNVSVFGSHFSTRDGSALRDYVHVTDIAGATLRTLEGLFSNRAAGPYNIGTGVETSVFEVIRAIEMATGQKCPVHYEAKRADEPPILTADPSRAEKELLWKPTGSSLDLIVSSVLEFRRQLWNKQIEAGLLRANQDTTYAGRDLMEHFATLSAATTEAKQVEDHIQLLKRLDAFLDKE